MKFTPEEDRIIIDAYNAGESMGAVAAKLGRSESGAFNRIQRLREAGHYIPHREAVAPSIRKDRMAEREANRLRKEGLTPLQIGLRLQKTEQWVIEQGEREARAMAERSKPKPDKQPELRKRRCNVCGGSFLMGPFERYCAPCRLNRVPGISQGFHS